MLYWSMFYNLFRVYAIIDKTGPIIFTYVFVFLSSIERKASVDEVGLKTNNHS